MNLEKLVHYRYPRGKKHKLKMTPVKNLTIKIQGNDLQYFERLFQCCDMLEVLSINLPRFAMVKLLNLLSNLPKLKYLKLSGEIHSEKFQQPTFKFNRLERLILFGHYWGNLTADQCVKIIRCSPNLTHLKMTTTLTKNDFEIIFQDCTKLQEIYLLPLVDIKFIDEKFSIFKVLTDEILETYKNVGSKIKIKIETNNKDDIEKLSDANNRLTALFKETSKCLDPFVVRPKILSHLYFDYSDNDQRDRL